MSDVEQEVKRIEEGEAWEATDEVVKVEVRRPLDKVIPVRLPSDTWEELRREARKLGVGPTTLARMWILEKLRREDEWMPSFPNRSDPVLTIEPSKITLESVLRSQHVDSLRASLEKANVLLVPQRDFRETSGLTFPSGTEDLFLHLRNKSPEGVTVEIAIGDEDYQELSLHEALTIVATIVVTSFAAPIVVNVVSDWLKHRLGKELSKSAVRTEIIVEDENGKSTTFRYEGPAGAFEETMRKHVLQSEEEVEKAPGE
jgi:hypothetical protein